MKRRGPVQSLNFKPKKVGTSHSRSGVGVHLRGWISSEKQVVLEENSYWTRVKYQPVEWFEEMKKTFFHPITTRRKLKIQTNKLASVPSVSRYDYYIEIGIQIERLIRLLILLFLFFFAIHCTATVCSRLYHQNSFVPNFLPTRHPSVHGDESLFWSDDCKLQGRWLNSPSL